MTDSAEFEVHPGETVTAFAVGALVERPFAGQITRGVDRVDYAFVNGFVDVGDLPCRIATWAEVASRPQPALQDFPVREIVLPGFGARLDFLASGTCPRGYRVGQKRALFRHPPGRSPSDYQPAAA